MLSRFTQHFKYSCNCAQGVTDIQLLAGALRVGGAHLGHNPDTLAFDLVGRLLYYYDDEDIDVDLARRGSNASATSAVGVQVAAGSSRKDGLKSLLQQCDAQSTQHSALLPILPCFDPPTAMSLFILEGHSQVACVFLSILTCVSITAHVIDIGWTSVRLSVRTRWYCVETA